MRCAKWRNWPPEAAGTESDLVEGLSQRGLLVRRLVLVDNALAGGLVQLAAGRHEQLGGLVLIALGSGGTEPADRGVQRALHRLVAHPAPLVGADALLLRLNVGHALIPRLQAWGSSVLPGPSGPRAATAQGTSDGPELKKRTSLACRNGEGQAACDR